MMEKKAKKEKEANLLEKSAKEAKEPSRRWVTTVKQALDRFKADPKARMTLAQLRESGFNEAKIAGCVVKYCGGDPEEAKAGLDEAKKCGKALADTAKQLSTSANYLEQALRLCEGCGLPVAGDELPQILRRYAEMFSNIASRTKNIRIDSSISSGRDGFLLCFAYAMGNGTKPSKQTYMQIATLVAAVTGEYRNYKSIVERLSKSVDRLAITDPGKRLIMMVEEGYFDDLTE